MSSTLLAACKALGIDPKEVFAYKIHPDRVILLTRGAQRYTIEMDTTGGHAPAGDVAKVETEAGAAAPAPVTKARAPRAPGSLGRGKKK